MQRPTIRLIATTALALAALLGAAPSRADLPVYTGSECTVVTVTELLAIRDRLETALEQARADCAAHCAGGAYASAPAESQRLLQRAITGHLPDTTDGIDDLIAFLERPGGQDPTVTTYAEAGHLMGGSRRIVETLLLAAHWSYISAVYHKSADAYQAVELSLAGVDALNGLLSQAYRCKIDAYKVPRDF